MKYCLHCKTLNENTQTHKHIVHIVENDFLIPKE